MSRLLVELATTPEELLALQPVWERLSAGSPSRSLYGAPQHLSIWWKHFGEDSARPFFLKRGFELAGDVSTTDSMFTMIVRDGNEIVGLLPLMLLQTRPRGSTSFVKCLCFLGDPVFTPSPTVTNASDVGGQVFQALADCLACAEMWDALLLFPIRKDFVGLSNFLDVLAVRLGGRVIRADVGELRYLHHWDRDKVRTLLRRLLEFGGPDADIQVLELFANELTDMSHVQFSQQCLPQLTPRLKMALERFGCPTKACQGILDAIRRETDRTADYFYQIVNLPDSFDDYWMRLSRRKRERARRLERQAQDAAVRVEFTPTLSAEDFDIFVAFHRNNHPNSVHFNNLTRSYYGEYLECLADDGALLWLLARNEPGCPVFFILFYLDRAARTTRPIVYGRDPKVVEFNIGEFCIMEAIKRSIEWSFRCFDFRMGDEWYKTGFNTTVVPIECFIASREDRILDTMLPRQWTVAATGAELA